MSTGMRRNSWDGVFAGLPDWVVDGARFAMACLPFDPEFVKRCDKFTRWCQSGKAPADGIGLSNRGLRAA